MADLSALADELEHSLWRDLVQPWFPRCVDPSGGFFQNFGRDWARGPDSSRFVVFQSRMTWLAATLAEVDEQYASTARHGLAFLRDRFVDAASGSVLWIVDSLGQPLPPLERHTYGASFTIYALAAAARALQSEEALDLATKVFLWLEAHAHDPEHGGYFETTDPSGEPILTQPGSRRLDGIGTAYGFKSQNTHLHLLEAFTELARVWRDERLIARLREVAEILEERLFSSAGTLHLYTHRDWRPVDGPCSYGHDIEAAHLLLDAAEVLDGAAGPRTRKVSQALVEHTLRYGWDRQHGGFFNAGDQDGAGLDRSKIWWVQAEALLGLARAMEVLRMNVEAELLNTWDWIRERQIDAEHGGWFDTLKDNGEVVGSAAKGHPWKAAYHDGRGLLFTARAIRRAGGFS